MIIKTLDQLRELYGKPGSRAEKKQLSFLDVHAINYIRKSPFLVVSTFSKNGGVDASPRGGDNGFVEVLNKNEIIIPDFKGNNRVDSLSNIVESGFVGILFFIPGIDETLRVNGKACISANKEHLDYFAKERNPPKACILVEIEEVFLHCAKAFMRSKLWLEESKLERSILPTMGQMLNDQLGSMENPETQEDMIERYQKEL